MVRAVLGLVAAVAVISAGAFAWVMYDLSSLPPAPNAHKLAEAADTRAARDRAVAFADEQTGRLRAAAPWAEVLDSSVADLCHAEAHSAGIGSKAVWSSVLCSRTTVLYAAFDGEIEPRLAELDRAVAGLGWKPRDVKGLVEQLHYMHGPPGEASPEAAAAAEARPNDVGVRFGLAAQRGTQLTVAVGDRRGLPLVGGSWDGWKSEHAVDGKPYTDRDNERAVYLDWRRVDGEALTAKAYAGHRYLVVIGVAQGYATGCPDATCDGPTWYPG
ncbi:hypothetical protein [Kitasatospora sp. NPDC047058]|uniref:hypothetical protein n=1 Tax=Kitasatospora sp. NPDC047058 TaxID=3155620 RepID=UPI0033E9B5C6